MRFFRRKQIEKQEPRPRPKKQGCEIEVKNTKTGKKLIIGEGCTKEQIRVFAERNNIDLED